MRGRFVMGAGGEMVEAAAAVAAKPPVAAAPVAPVEPVVEAPRAAVVVVTDKRRYL